MSKILKMSVLDEPVEITIPDYNTPSEDTDIKRGYSSATKLPYGFSLEIFFDYSNSDYEYRVENLEVTIFNKDGYKLSSYVSAFADENSIEDTLERLVRASISNIKQDIKNKLEEAKLTIESYSKILEEI